MIVFLLALLSCKAQAYDLDHNFKAFRRVESNVTWSRENSTPEIPDTKYAVNASTPFGTWFMPLARWVEREKRRGCSWSPHLLADPKLQYEDGEIPCGVPAQNAKIIYDVELPAAQFAVGDWDYSITGGHAFVGISRQPLADLVTDSDLNTKSEITGESSLRFADDIRIQNDGRVITVCTRVPGVQVVLTVTPRLLHGSYRPDPRVQDQRTFSPAVQPSLYLVSKACSSISFNERTPPSAPIIGKPELSGLSVQPAPLPSDPVFAQVVELDQAVIKKKLTADQMFDSNELDPVLADGSWAPRLMAERFTLDVTQTVARKALEILERIGNPLSSAALQTQLQDRCRLLEMSPANTAVWTDNMRGFCQEHVEKISFASVPVDINSAELARGCFSGSANIYDLLTPEPHRRWWTRHCTVTSGAELSLPEALKSYAPEFETLLWMLGHGPQPFGDWDLKMRDSRVDIYQLWLMLEGLEREGHHDVLDQDWPTMAGTNSDDPIP